MKNNRKNYAEYMYIATNQPTNKQIVFAEMRSIKIEYAPKYK